MNKVSVISAEVEPRLKLTLIAQREIEVGEVIFSCKAEEIQTHRTWRTVQVGFAQHLKNAFLDYVDHSCDPNTVLRIDDLSFVAIAPIAEGDSVTFFYPGAEVELAQGFQCECGSENCLGFLRGGFYLSAEEMRWAIDNGYCTSFIEGELRRLLAL